MLKRSVPVPDDNALLDDAIDMLFWRFNEPVVPRESIKKWLNRFCDEDKPVKKERAALMAS